MKVIKAQEGRVAETNVFLKALTPEAKSALGGSLLKISRFPFRVGRECRIRSATDGMASSRRRLDAFPNNDLYLNEHGTVLNVSREHFLIDRQEGIFLLVDRGSACGTIVEGEQVGEKKQGGWRRVHSEDVIIVGTSESRFIFKFIVVENP